MLTANLITHANSPPPLAQGHYFCVLHGEFFNALLIQKYGGGRPALWLANDECSFR